MMTDGTALDAAMAQIAAMDDGDPLLEGAAEDHGRFVGLPAKIELDPDDGRSARLLAPISYFTPDDEEWEAPTGAWLDGASIPKAFWSIIGGPFEGRYREPSIVHDQFCITKERAWQDTHRMFHTAMLCRGVSGFKARVMFYAVYRFGPRWPDPLTETIATEEPTREPDEADAASILRDAAIIRDTEPGEAEIEALAEAAR